MSCTLCAQPLPKNAPTVNDRSFCCLGCQTVFDVLQAKKSVHLEKDPLYQQAHEVGVISEAQTPFSKDPIDSGLERQKVHFEIKDMWCPSCARAITWILERQKGVTACKVDYATDVACIEFAPCLTSEQKVLERIKKLGYRGVPLLSPEILKKDRSLVFRLCIAAFLSLNLMMLSVPLYTDFLGEKSEGYASVVGILSFFLALPLITFCASAFWRRFLVTLKTAIIGMETLVLMGSGACFVTSVFELLSGHPEHLYFDSMGMIITLVLLGKLIESKAKLSAKETLFLLFRTLPKKARVIKDKVSSFVPLKNIAVGDTLLSLTGEKIVLDGEVVSGCGSVDESLMTGESMPKAKKQGDTLIAGSVLLSGSLTYLTQKTETQTCYFKILEVVEKGLHTKATYFRAADAVVAVFVPAVLLVALTPFFFLPTFNSALLRACSILLISCPCAIGIAAPLAESFLIKKLSSLGALVQNRAALSKLATLTDMVFDKTGTLTTGKFKVLSGLKNLSCHELQILKSLASHSNHPLSLAIHASIKQEPLPLTFVEEVAGAGMYGVYQGKRYALGSAKLFKQAPFPKTDALVSLVYFGKGDRIVATLSLGDQLKEDARTSVARLAPLKIHLFSGDAPSPVKIVAKGCAIEHYQSSLDPFEKKEAIEELQKKGNIVAMIGDGINDAAALTQADVGISVLGATDLCSQVSDIILTQNQLTPLAHLFFLARKGRKILRQNLMWAFSYNVVGIGLALIGVLSPLLSALFMVLSSCCVIANTFRIRKRPLKNSGF